MAHKPLTLGTLDSRQSGLDLPDEPEPLLPSLAGEADDLRPWLPQVRPGHHLRQHLCHLLQCTLRAEGGGGRG